MLYGELLRGTCLHNYGNSTALKEIFHLHVRALTKTYLVLEDKSFSKNKIHYFKGQQN